MRGKTLKAISAEYHISLDQIWGIRIKMFKWDLLPDFATPAERDIFQWRYEKERRRRRKIR